MRIQQNIKSLFFEKTKLSRETFLMMNSKSQEYSKKLIFDIIFHMFIFITSSYNKCKSIWNNSIDYIDFIFPYISNTFQLRYLKTDRNNNEHFKFTAIKLNPSDDYQITYSNNQKDIFNDRSNYDVIMVNHVNKNKHTNTHTKHIRLFNKEQIESIQSEKDLEDYQEVEVKPFIYLSINKNIDNTYDPEHEKNELNHADNLDNPVIQDTLSMFYVKNNILNRSFLEFIFRHYFQVNLNQYPNYVIDCITHDIVQKQYTKRDTFEFKV